MNIKWRKCDDPMRRQTRSFISNLSFVGSLLIVSCFCRVIISSKWPSKADSSLKLNVPEKTLKPITKLKKLKFLTLLKQKDRKGDLSF